MKRKLNFKEETIPEDVKEALEGFRRDEKERNKKEEEESSFEFEDPLMAKGFTPFPKIIQLCPALSINARFLCGVLLSFAWGEKTYSFPGIKRLMYIMNRSQSQINQYLNELKRSGILWIKRRGLGKTNLYIFKKIPNKTFIEYINNNLPDQSPTLDPDKLPTIDLGKLPTIDPDKLPTIDKEEEVLKKKRIIRKEEEEEEEEERL